MISTSVIHDNIDYEAINVVAKADAGGLRRVVRWVQDDANAPGGKNEHTATFVTRPEDLESARRIIVVWQAGDPEMMPGSTQGAVSRALRREFLTGAPTPIVLGAVRASSAAGLLGGLLVGRKYYRGSLTRVEPNPVPLPLIVDGQRTTVPTIHVRGAVSVGSDTGNLELWILDDVDYPLILRWDALGSSVRVVRIDNPPAPRTGHPGGGGGAPEIGDALSKGGCHAELHGIYFATGSAKLLAESKPALDTIATALNAHPDWVVVVEGHTDNIGGAESNLKLSRDRATAVRDALIANYKIAPARLSAAGFGLTRPIEPNATLEGRARNRRVELSRQCK